MHNLSTPAASATTVFNWLVANQDMLTGPLGTCRLLLAPSQSEIDGNKMPNEAGWHLADHLSFAKAAKAWRKDAASRAGNTTFFYFAGHGLHLDSLDHVLLFPGYGEPDQSPWHGTISLNELNVGMAPSEVYPHIAKNQFYFVDACRTRIRERMKNNEVNQLPSFWNTPTRVDDYRHDILFQTATYGSPAYSIPGEVTVFAKSLVDCLTRVAGKIGSEADSYDDLGEPVWWVTTNSLNDALNYQMPKVSDFYKLPRQQIKVSHLTNVRIARLPKRPAFDVTVILTPEGAEKQIRELTVSEVDADLTDCKRAPWPEHPFCYQFPGGQYTVKTIPVGRPTGFIADSPAKVWKIRLVEQKSGGA